jgi:GxxExxY protein
MEINEITKQIIGCAIRVHSRLGPGVLENSYEACLAHELEKAGVKVVRQVALPLAYDEVRLEVGYRLDLLVENQVVVEIKAQERILPLHGAVVSYLRLTGCKVGLLLNFHEVMLKNGIVRKVNNYKEPSASSQLALTSSALKRLEAKS